MSEFHYVQAASVTNPRPHCGDVSIVPSVPFDSGRARPADPSCRSMHDWAACRRPGCGYRPAGLIAGTWHYADECPLKGVR